MTQCLVKSIPPANWARAWYCSLPPEHDGMHLAYNSHKVTGCGRDIAWLGPWEDGRQPDPDEVERLTAEWLDRYSPDECLVHAQ